jgi:hypothetical protein
MDGIRLELFKDAIFPKVLDKDDYIVQGDKDEVHLHDMERQG